MLSWRFCIIFGLYWKKKSYNMNCSAVASCFWRWQDQNFLADCSDFRLNKTQGTKRSKKAAMRSKTFSPFETILRRLSTHSCLQILVRLLRFGTIELRCNWRDNFSSDIFSRLSGKIFIFYDLDSPSLKLYIMYNRASQIWH